MHSWACSNKSAAQILNNFVQQDLRLAETERVTHSLKIDLIISHLEKIKRESRSLWSYLLLLHTETENPS